MPSPGNALYDVAFWGAVVALAYLDADSPPGGRETFFKDAHQALSLGTDSVAYLFQEQQSWQEEVSPTFKARTWPELIAAMRKLQEADGEVFFSRCSPYMQSKLALFMAGLLAKSPEASSLAGSPSARSTETTSPLRRPRRKGPTRRK